MAFLFAAAASFLGDGFFAEGARASEALRRRELAKLLRAREAMLSRHD